MPTLKLLSITLLSYLLIKIIIKYAHKLKLLDVPNDRSHHCSVIPRGAGIGFMVAMLLSVVVYESNLFLENWSIFLAILMVFGVGIVDVRDIKALSSVLDSGDVIINLAAEHRDDVTPKTLYDDVNVQGARNVCEVATQKGINTIIFTSSVAVYGFAPIGTDESGEINYFNDYGRTKWEAEKVYRAWQEKEPITRKLVIVRPAVVFGEQNRGNVYNLLRQIASGKFVMIGDGKNRKSMVYVENVSAFLEYSLSFNNGVHVYNYIDKPDFDMNTLVSKVYKALGKNDSIGLRLPYIFGYAIGKVFDVIAMLSGKKFAVSSIRVKKFCSDSMFDTSVAKSGFVPPVKLEDGLAKTIKYEFVDKQEGEVFFTE